MKSKSLIWYRKNYPSRDLVKTREISLIFKKAPFQAIMPIISFVLFVGVYWFVTVRAIEPYYFDGVSLLLISPYIKGYVDTNNIDKDKYYILSEKEFNTGYIKDIIGYLEKLDSIGI